MAILSALLSLLTRKVGDVVTAILGWSVTALFGQLPRTKKVALSVTLLVSLTWPLLVAGIAYPPITAWAFALVPLHDWIGDEAVRIVSIVLAVIVPPIVGAVTHWIAPARARKGGLLRTMIHGYPLTLGYAVSCLLTAVTVPIVKVASFARRWTDTHVFVQPREGEYQAALEEIARACKLAGVEGRVESVPTMMALSTRVMKWFARGGLDPILAADPRMIRAPRLQVYLYPADLLLRGEPHLVAKVRAQIAESMLERHAFLVADGDSQELATQIMRMWDVLARHQSPQEIGGIGRARLAEIQHDADRAQIPFEDWISLDRSLRRIERELAPGEHLLDRESQGFHPDSHAKGPIMERQPRPLATAPTAHDTPTAELMRSAFDEAKTLIKLEVELAKREARSEITRLKTAGVAFAIATLTAILGLAMLLVSLVLATGAEWEVALGIAGVLLVSAGAAAFVGAGALPKTPLDRTRHRALGELQELRERVA